MDSDARKTLDEARRTIETDRDSKKGQQIYRRRLRRIAAQSTYIPRVSQCMSTRPNWDPLPPHHPSHASECGPPSGTKGRGNTCACE